MGLSFGTRMLALRCNPRQFGFKSSHETSNHVNGRFNQAPNSACGIVLSFHFNIKDDKQMNSIFNNVNGTRIRRIMALVMGIGTVAIIVTKILHDGLAN
jgi:hypothetical protein